MPSTDKPFHGFEDGVAGLRIHSDGRFVQDQQRGPVQQSDADVQPAFHAAGVLFGQVAGTVAQPDQFQHLVGAPREVLARESLQPAEELQVLPGRQVRVDGQFLRDQADDPLGLRLGRGHVATRHSDGALVGRDQAGDHGDDGGLSRAVGSQQAIGLPGTDVEGNTVDGGQVPVAPDEPADVQHVLGCYLSNFHSTPSRLAQSPCAVVSRLAFRAGCRRDRALGPRVAGQYGVRRRRHTVGARTTAMPTAAPMTVSKIRSRSRMPGGTGATSRVEVRASGSRRSGPGRTGGR